MIETDSIPSSPQPPEVGTTEWRTLCKQNELRLENVSHGGIRKGAGRPKLTKEEIASREVKKHSPINKKMQGKLNNAHKKLVNLTPKAIDRLAQMLDSGEDQDARQAAEAILRRTMPEIKQDVSSDKPVMIVYLPEKSKSDLWQEKAQEVLETRARAVNETSK